MLRVDRLILLALLEGEIAGVEGSDAISELQALSTALRSELRQEIELSLLALIEQGLVSGEHISGWWSTSSLTSKGEAEARRAKLEDRPKLQVAALGLSPKLTALLEAAQCHTVQNLLSRDLGPFIAATGMSMQQQLELIGKMHQLGIHVETQGGLRYFYLRRGL